MTTNPRHHIGNLTRATLFGSLLFALLITATSCTRNNGDIGDWFGKWQVMEISADGKPEAGYEPRYFWEFQNDIIRIAYVGPQGYDREIYYCFGTWSQPSDNVIVFDFSHSDDSGTLIYAPFAGMHFPADKPFTLSITAKSGNNCTMKYLDQQTATEYTYLLRKR